MSEDKKSIALTVLPRRGREIFTAPVSGKPSITLCENPFNLTRDQRKIELLPPHLVDRTTTAETLGAVLEREKLGTDFVFSCNGEVLPPERALAYAPQPGDDVMLVPQLHNSVLRTIAMIGVSIAAVAFAGPLGGVLAGMFGSLSTAAATAIAGSLISIGGSLLVNGIASLFMKKPGGYNYGVLGPTTTARSGMPIPRGGGTMRSAGNVVESWIDIMGNNEDAHDVDDGADTIGRQYINVRVDFGFGPAIAFANIMLNSKDIAEYSDVAYCLLYGTNDQAPVTVEDSRWVVLNKTTTGTTQNYNPTIGFDTLNNNYPQNQRIRAGVTNNFVIVQGQRVDTQKLTVYVTFPQGVWRYDDDMIIKRLAISYDVYYRTSATATAEAGAWVHVAGSGTPNGESHYYYNIRQTILRQATIIDDLPPARYDVKVVKNGSGPVGDPDYFNAGEWESNMYGDELWFESLQETSYTTMSYPNMIQMCVRIMATDSISGSDVGFTADITYGLRNALPAPLAGYGPDVPACVAYDILVDDVVGADLDPADIDLDLFADWAALSESEVDNGDGGTAALAKFNGVFDQQVDIWAALNTIAVMSRANMQRVGRLVTGWLDQPDTPVQMFHMGNILKDSYSKEYLNLEDRAQEIEVNFADVADNYKTRNPIRVVFDQDENSDEALKKTQVNLLGCTNQVQAYYWGVLKLYESETLLRAHTWRSNAQAIRCRAGNVVLLQHDLPIWAYGGLLQPGSTASRLILDRNDCPFDGTANNQVIVCHPALLRMSVLVTAITGNVLTVAIGDSGYSSGISIARLQQGNIDVAITNHDGTSVTVEDASGLVTGTAELWDLDVMETRTVTTLAGDAVTLSEPLSAVPADFASFIYQTLTRQAILVRIRSIQKEVGSQRYTIKAIDYADATYDLPPPPAGSSYVPPVGTTGTGGGSPSTDADLAVQYVIYTGGGGSDFVPVGGDPPPPGSGDPGGSSEEYQATGVTIRASGSGYTSSSTAWMLSTAVNSSGDAEDPPQALTLALDGTGAITGVSGYSTTYVWKGVPYIALYK